MEVKIMDWINSVHDALDLGDILEFAKQAQMPGTKVTMVKDATISEYGMAVTLYRGTGTDDEIRAALLKAIDEAV
jgi:hypothetical protein